MAEAMASADGAGAEDTGSEDDSFGDEDTSGFAETSDAVPELQASQEDRRKSDEDMVRKASSRRAELDLNKGRAQEELHAALRRAPGERSDDDIDIIFERALSGAQDMFLQGLPETVRRLICQRLALEERLTNDIVIDFGEIGDKLYLIISGRVRVDIPHGPMGIGGALAGDLVPLVWLDPGRVFGERALFTEDCKRNARVITLSKEDYEWCVARANDDGDQKVDRISFLQTLD
eukprot:CAMPEP_0170322810 /NCGR_PEP_ID=MMETSP0116_2-20130129/62194_1 /TAXON_ID=400756 /ORGANISM="Durinskia baltica, Strain CSIRO CS-38" /LENGTH=233 /DNA_ID=CAMNT_0010575691 /DNA_START=1 /DNA_END=699 /DNA_ORIENTATION=+